MRFIFAFFLKVILKAYASRVRTGLLNLKKENLENNIVGLCCDL